MQETEGLRSAEMDTKVERYDLIVEGTGIVESIVACAASRSGKSVLHLDSNDFYGCKSASFPLQDFLVWCRAASREPDDEDNSSSRLSPVEESSIGHILNPNNVNVIPSDGSSSKQIVLGNSSKSLLRVIDFKDVGERYIDHISHHITADHGVE